MTIGWCSRASYEREMCLQTYSQHKGHIANLRTSKLHIAIIIIIMNPCNNRVHVPMPVVMLTRCSSVNLATVALARLMGSLHSPAPRAIGERVWFLLPGCGRVKGAEGIGPYHHRDRYYF